MVLTRKLMGVENITKAHHRYPCTATMSVDPEVKEPILDIGGLIIRKKLRKH